MGRNRTATNVLEARGAFGKHPERRRERKNEPKNLPKLGAPPRYLSKDQKAAWRKIVKDAPAGILTQADEISVEIASRLYAEMRAGTINRAGMKQLDSLLSKFGMNPSDRSKVSVPAKKKPSTNPFAKV